MSDDDQKPTTISDIRNDASSAAKADLSSLPEVDPAYYTLGKEVGRGGMGRVLEARDLRVGRSVVLKELLDESPSHALRFEREARVTARLQHPAIVPIYEIGKWPDGAPFYAMRMVEGRNLRTAIADAKTLAERLALLPSVIVAAEAIAYAHAHRVIHRDLKPSNIMVGDFGETIVIDWGLAKDLGDGVPEEHDVGPYRDAGTGELTLVGAVVGTPAYMPPEQARGEAVDERGDVYSLGAILYHLLAGEAPFRAGKSEDLLEAVKAAAPAPIAERAAEAPRDLLSIVDKAMARDPATRYANATELVAELVRFRTGQLVGAHRYSRGELARRWLREHRFVVIGSLAALLALAVAGTVAIVGIVRERDRADAERVMAVRQREKADDTTLALFEEQGRQQLLQNEPARALVYLNEAFKSGRDTPALRLMLADALRPLENQRVLTCDGPAVTVNLSPDGHLAAVGCQTSIKLFDLANSALMAELPLTAPLGRLAFSHDGTELAASGTKLVVWNIRSRSKLVDIELEPDTLFVQFTDDDAAVVTEDSAGSVRVWDPRRGTEVRKLHLGTPPLKDASVAMTADTAAQLSLYGEVELVHVKTGRVQRFSTGWRAQRLYADRTGRFVVCGVGGARVFDTEGRVIRDIGARAQPVQACAISPDGKQIVVGTMSSGTTFVDVDTGVVSATLDLRYPARIAYSASGRNVAVYNALGADVFDAAVESLVLHLPVVTYWGDLVLSDTGIVVIDHDVAIATPYEAYVRSFVPPIGDWLIAVSKDGSRAVTRRDDGVLTIWNTDTRQPIGHDPIRQQSRQGGDVFSFDEPTGLEFSEDSEKLAVIRWNDLAVLDATTGKTEQVFARPPTMEALVFDKHRERLLVGGKKPAVWDLSSGRDLLAGVAAKAAFMLSDEGHQVVVQLEQGLELFDLDRHSGTELRVGAGPYEVSRFSEGGHRVVIESELGGNGRAHVSICNTQNGDVISQFSTSGAHLSASKSLLAITIKGAIEIRRVEDGHLISRAQRWIENGRGVRITVPSDDGHFLLFPSQLLWMSEVADARSGQTITSIGRDHMSQHLLARHYLEDLALGAWWNGSTIVNTGGGVVVSRFRIERRTAQQVDAIVRRVTPWQLADGSLKLRRGSLHGHVTSHGRPAAAALITINNNTSFKLPYTTTTDAVGNYHVDDVQDDSYDVTAKTASGLSTKKTAVVSFRGDTTLDLDLN